MMKHKTKFMGIGLATLMVVSLIAMTGAVSAAPTVTNAAGSAPTGWYNPVLTQYGGAAISSSNGNVYGTVQAQALNPTWVNLGKPTGKTLQSNPSAVYDPAGRVVFFVATTDGGIWAKAVDAATLSTTTVFDWTQIPGAACAAGTGPGAAVANILGVNQVALFYVGTSNELEYMWANLPVAPTMGWQGPTNLHGYLTSSPSACSRDANIIDVFARGQSGGLWSRDYGAQGFGAWYEVPGFGYLAAGTGPSAIAPTGGTMYVFVTGGSDQVYYQYWNLAGIPVTQWNQVGRNIGWWNVATDLDGHLLGLSGYIQVSGSSTSLTPAAIFGGPTAPNNYQLVLSIISGGNGWANSHTGAPNYALTWHPWAGPVQNLP